MPIHNYWCDYCKTEKQRRSSFEDLVDRIVCPHCGKWMHKMIQVPNVIYRGKGFSKADEIAQESKNEYYKDKQ